MVRMLRWDNIQQEQHWMLSFFKWGIVSGSLEVKSRNKSFWRMKMSGSPSKNHDGFHLLSGAQNHKRPGAQICPVMIPFPCSANLQMMKRRSHQV